MISPLLVFVGAVQKSKARPQMRIPSVSGPLVLAFASMEERDRVVNQLAALRASVSEKKTMEPGGPHAEVKKELLQSDRSAALCHIFTTV